MEADGRSCFERPGRSESGGPKVLWDKRCKGGNEPLGEPLPSAEPVGFGGRLEGAGL